MITFRRKPTITLHARRINPWVTINAANGQVLFTSQIYSSLGAARRAAVTLQLHTGWRIKDVKP